MEKENQRVVITKKMLKDGILRLLHTKSIDQINVTELCRESGINRATFYTHYQTPHDVLGEIEEDLHQTLQKELQKKGQPNYKTDIEEITETICVFIDENAELVRILLSNAADHALRNMLKKTYTSMIKEQIVADADDEDLLWIATYLTGGVFFVLKLWMEGNTQKTPHEIAQIISKLYNDKLLA